jgi:thiaminase/transcriptional activator TenA
MKAAGPFTFKLWFAIQPVYQQIINCSFVKLLANGTLPLKCFKHYLAQDILYIVDDARALAVTAARADNTDDMYFLLQLAKDGLDIERALQTDMVKHFNIEVATQKSPAFRDYANFLHKHAYHSPYPVALASLLPCFWVYHNAGKHMKENSMPYNPYYKWLNTYSDDIYNHYVAHFIQITEKEGLKANAILQEEMINAFREGTVHELRVFEEAASVFGGYSL